MLEAGEIDSELELILEDDVEDYVEPDEDSFPYDDTKVISIGMKKELMEAFQEESKKEDLPVELQHLQQKWQSLIRLIEHSVDFFVVEWDENDPITTISMVVYAGGLVPAEEGGYVTVIESADFKNLISAINSSTILALHNYQNVNLRSEFKLLIGSMCRAASLFEIGMNYLWPFRGWSR